MFPTIQTERTLLRQIIASDLPYIFEGLSHPDTTRFYGVKFDSMVATQEQMKWFANLENTKTGIWWAICSKDNSTFYGAAGFNNLQAEHQKTELGCWLLPRFFNHRLMSETIPAICQYAFKELALHRIEAFVEKGNLPCQALLKKLAFQHEGTMTDCEQKDNQFISIEIWAKLNDGNPQTSSTTC